MNQRFAACGSLLLAVACASNAGAQAPQQPPLQQLPPQPGYPPGQLPPQTYPQQQPQVPPQGYPQQGGYPQQPAPQPYAPQPQQQQVPPQGYPQQQLPPQQPGGYPQQQQLPPQGYPQQPWPPQGYPQQPVQPYPQAYPPQGAYPQQAMPPPGLPPQPPGPLAPPVPNGMRDPNEMAVLYGTSIAYGVGSGIWIDGLAHVSDPGIAFIAPLALGVAAPLGVYLWDDNYEVHRGVPASISAGLALGAVEGIAVSGTQWQHSDRGGPSTWSFATQSSVTWLMATGGGVGGYAFGEWLHPDPRSLGFIADGAAWGAISASFLGAGVGSGDWKNGASIGGLLGYNAGILATGALSISGYVPSWRTQQAMWLGFLVGSAASSVVYLFYIGSNDDPRHGMIANSLGGLAGVGIAALLTANMKDPDQTSKGWLPPFQVGITPTAGGGASLSAYGMF